MQSPTEARHCAHLSKSFESSENQTLSGCRFPAASFRLKRQGKAMNTGLYLAQSYQDAWSDYQRSVRNASFPVWDYVVLTASNAHQAFRHSWMHAGLFCRHGPAFWSSLMRAAYVSGAVELPSLY